MSAEAFINRYRPQEWDEVIGQEKIVASLKSAVESRRSQAFLLSGGSGCGKTTLARIAAAKAQCEIQDYNAAKNTGVDDVRELTEPLMYKPLNGRGLAFVIDECHMLSKNAWNALLKEIEEPPRWAYWFFCTTELTKVPKSIVTRCLSYELRAVSVRGLVDLLNFIVKEEKSKTPPAVVALCAEAADGSPRQAISNLSKCLQAKTPEDAEELLGQVKVEVQAIELARNLYNGPSWKECKRIIASLPEGSRAESIRHMVRAYGTKVVLGAKDEKTAGRALEVLDSFSTPFFDSEGLAPLLLACARLTIAK